MTNREQYVSGAASGNNPLESTLQEPARVAGKTAPRAKTIVYWIATGLFCLQMSFTAYAQLSLPQVAEAFTHLGFPAYFRVELSWAKFLGVALLLAPVPNRLKEWAYAGFAINLASALIAHLSVGDSPGSWSWAAGTSVLWALSYFFWRQFNKTRTPGEDR
jgi:DoxX-like family